MPVRIAFCITELDPGGAERALVQLVTRLDRAEWEPAVFSLGPRGPLADQLDAAAIPTTCLNATSKLDVLVVKRLTNALREFKPQILQTYLHHANIVGRIAGKRAKVEHIVSGIRVAERRSRWPLRIDRLTERLVSRHVCVSQAVATFSTMIAGLSEEKIVVIPNGVDTERFRNAQPVDLSQFGIPPDTRTLLFVGRLDPQKGPFLFLRAVESLVSTYRDFHVLIVGTGPLEEKLRERVVQTGVESRVHFAGWRDDVPAIMKSVDALVLPSQWEGMPNVVLEAMAAGLPVLSTGVEGVTELIQNHQTGLIVEPDSLSALAGGIAIMLSDPHQTRELGIAAQQFVSKHFTWNDTVRQYIELYGDLLNESAG